MPPFVFTPFPNLSTERLVLRSLEEEDAHKIYALRSDDKVNEFLIRPKAKSLEEAQEFIRKIKNSISNDESIYWVITLKNDNKVIGTIMLWNIVEKELKAEIGYELLPDYWGMGIIQEAFSKVLEYGFRKMELQTIVAGVDPKNKRSLRFLEKNNFRTKPEKNLANLEEITGDAILYLDSPYK